MVPDKVSVPAPDLVKVDKLLIAPFTSEAAHELIFNFDEFS